MRKSVSPIYYGWFVLAAAAISEMLAQGATSYSAGLFVLPLQSEFHISRANASSSILILFLGSALVAPLVGRLLDKYPVRLIVSAGAVIFSLALTIIAFTTSLWVMAAMLVLPAAIGFMSVGPLTTSTLASRWFFRHRGLALGIAAVATSGGGAVVVPLLSRAIRLHGWRLGLFYEAVTIGVIVVALALLVLRDNPFGAGLGEHPENRGRLGAGHQAPGNSPLRWRGVLGNRGFWLPCLALASISGICQALVVTLVPYGVQLGFSAISAAIWISGFSIAAGVTKVSAGVLADRINQQGLLISASVFMMLSLILLCFFTTYSGIMLSSGLAGVSLGCAMPTAAALIAVRFGSASFGFAMGWIYVFTGFFAILSVRFMGSMFDSMGNYRFAFIVLLAFATMVLGLNTVFAVWPGKRPLSPKADMGSS